MSYRDRVDGKWGVCVDRFWSAHLSARNVVDPHEQVSVPIGRTDPVDSCLAAYGESQRAQTATILLCSYTAITPEKSGNSRHFNPFHNCAESRLTYDHHVR